VNSGEATPEINIENVLSLIFDKLSVARITNVYVVSLITNPGNPELTPSVDNVNPRGKVPLIKVYVTDIAGSTGCATTITVILGIVFAVPVPEPDPVAVKVIPTVLLEAPIKVKSVLPIVTIVYESPAIKDPALTITLAGNEPKLPGLVDQIGCDILSF
jgi:hypothetical protein